MALSDRALVTLSALRQHLGITAVTDDSVLESCIDRASAAIEKYCGRQFTQQRRYEWIDTYGASRFSLRHAPVSLVRFVGVGLKNAMSINSTLGTDVARTVTVLEDSLRLYRMTSTGAAIETTIDFDLHQTTSEVATQIGLTTGFSAASLDDFPARYLRRIAGRDLKDHTLYLEAASESFSDYQIDLDSGVIYGSTLRSWRGAFVDYTAGYETVPYDVQAACIDLASRMYRDRQRDPSVQTESLGGYSYSRRSSAELSQSMRDMVGNWRRIR